jgi:hypothetical protein
VEFVTQIGTQESWYSSISRIQGRMQARDESREEKNCLHQPSEELGMGCLAKQVSGGAQLWTVRAHLYGDFIILM